MLKLFTAPTSNHSHKRDCNDISTGVGGLVSRYSAQSRLQVNHTIFHATDPLWILSYVIVAFSTSVGMSLLGVVFASISSGIGELTFLALSANFDKNTVSTWSSGTGGAGIFGALSYAGLIQVGLSSRNVLLLMLVMPVIFAICYWIVLVKPDSVHEVEMLKCKTWMVPLPNDEESRDEKALENNHDRSISMARKMQLTAALFKYMIPLALVYFAEYFINQGLHELIFFPGLWLSHGAQYRWYQVLYQFGVFISRSSVNVIKVPGRWLFTFPVLQITMATVFFFEAYHLFIPSIWITFSMTLFEGFLGGGAYVNTFYIIRTDVDPRHVEFSLGVASVADTIGVMCAAFSAIPVHNLLCHLPLQS